MSVQIHDPQTALIVAVTNLAPFVREGLAGYGEVLDTLMGMALRRLPIDALDDPEKLLAMERWLGDLLAAVVDHGA